MPGLFMNQNIEAISKVSRDKWGDRTSTILYQNVPCRFTDNLTKIREVSSEGDKVDAVAYIEKKFVVAMDYIVTFESEDYIISGFAKERDLFGKVHHQKLILKSR